MFSSGWSSNVIELDSGIGVLGLNAATTAKVVLCSDTNEYVDEVCQIDSRPYKYLTGRTHI